MYKSAFFFNTLPFKSLASVRLKHFLRGFFCPSRLYLFDQMQKKIAIIFHNVTVYFVVSIKKLNSLDEHKNSIKNLTDLNFLNSNVFKKIYIYMYIY